MLAAAFRSLLSVISNPKVEEPEGSAEVSEGVTDAMDQRRKQLLDDRSAAQRKADEERGAEKPSVSAARDGAAVRDKYEEDYSRRSEERRSYVLSKNGYGSK